MGGAGLITPDVTPDVVPDWIAAADARDLDKVFLVAPSSTDAEAVKQAVRDANLEPPSDVHASSEYRRHLAEVLAVRAVDQARGGA